MQSVCFCSSPQTFHLPLLSWLWGLSERIHVKYFQQCSTQWVLSTLAIGVVVVVSVLLFLPNVILTYTFHLVHFSALTQKPVFVAKQLSGQFSLWARLSILCTRPQAAFVFSWLQLTCSQRQRCGHQAKHFIYLSHSVFTVTEGRSCYTHFIDKETKTQRGKVTQRSHIAPRCQVRTPTHTAQWLWVPVLLVHLVLPLEHEADTSSSLETEKCSSSFLLRCSAQE